MTSIIIDHSREKLLNLISYFVKNTKYCGKTKLFKLLYYADMRYFKEVGRTITGFKYFTWKKGPVPKELFFEIKNPKQDFNDFFTLLKTENDTLKILVKKKFNNFHFTEKEVKIIEDISFIFKDAKANEMVKCTHLPNDPWSITLREKGEDQEIAYTLAFDNSPHSLTKEEYRERVEEVEQLKKAFE